MKLKHHKSNKIEIYRIYALVASIAAVFCSAVVWKYTNEWPFPSYIPRVICILFCTLMVLHYPKIRRTEICWILVLTIYLLFYLAFRRNDVSGYLLTVVSSFVIFVFLCTSALREGRLSTILSVFSNVVVLLALISLIMWLFGSVLGVIPGKRLVNYYYYSKTWSAYSYWNLYFEVPEQSLVLFGVRIPRNVGVFVEAPSFASYLIYALLIELFVKNEKKRWHFIVLVLTILTTFSAKSYIFLMELIFLQVCFDDKKKFLRKSAVRFVSLIIVLILVAIGIYYVFEIKSEMSSYRSRVASMIGGIQTWFNHPLFGTGYGDSSEIVANAGLKTGATNTSMGFTTLLGQGGLFLAMFYLFPYFLVGKRALRSSKKTIFIFFSVITLTDLFISRIIYSVYYQMIIAIGYSSIILRERLFKEE